MKKIFYMLVLIVSVWAVSLNAVEENVSYGNNYYKLSGDTAILLNCLATNGVIVIDDTVKYKGRSYEVTAIAKKHMTAGWYSKIEVSIPNTVKYIGKRAFYISEYYWGKNKYKDCRLHLRPDNNILMVGDSAFAYSNLLDTIRLPKVLSIGISAFQSYEKIKGVELGDDLHTIGKWAFWGCGLRSVEFGKSIRKIGLESFAQCPDLSSVKFRGAPDSIAKDAFYYIYDPDTHTSLMPIKEVDISDPGKWSRVWLESMYSNPIVQLGKFTVNGKEVRHLDLTAGLEGIGAKVFACARNLETVRVTGGGTVGSEAFLTCTGVTDLCLEVDSIKNYAFSGLVSLKRIYSMTAVPPATDNDIFSTYSGITLYVPVGSGDAYRSHPVWCRFSKVEETDFTGIDALFKADYDVSGIEEIPTDFSGGYDEDAPVRIYTLDGRLAGGNADRLRPGIYILRQGRKARKITVR